MTRIDPLNRGMGALPGVRRKARGKKAGPEPERNDAGVPVSVLPLVDEIATTSEGLLNDPTGSHLDLYKDAVRRFLDAAVSDSMRINSEATHGLTQKIFSTIARIDVALADLVDAVLGRQQNVLKAREIVDQIKGMIVDLYR